MTRSTPGSLDHVPIRHEDLLTLDGGGRDPILVVGMHNSGTSILAKVLHQSGVFLGNNMDHYESHFFSIFINDLLIMQGANNWAKLPLLSIDEVRSYRETVGEFVRKHWFADYLQWGYDGVSMWGIKDPRLCVLLPLYLDIFPGAKVVHIRRDPNDVAASLCAKNKRGVGVYDDFEHWRQLAIEYANRVTGYAAKCDAYHELQYEDFCTRTMEVAEALFAFLDIEISDSTAEVLAEVSSARIGSFERYQRLKSAPRLGRVARRVLRKGKY